MVNENNRNSETLFVGLYPTELYLYFLTINYSNKKFNKIDLFTSKILLANINKKYLLDYDKITDFPLLDTANTSSIKYELNPKKLIKNIFWSCFIFFKLKKILSSNNYQNVYFSDSSEGLLTSRIMIKMFTKKKINIHRLGYCNKRYNREAHGGIINFLNNSIYFMLPKVNCIVSQKNLILLERQFQDTIYTSKYIYSAKGLTTNNDKIINFNLKSSNISKKKIYFFDRGPGMLSFYNYEFELYERHMKNILFSMSKNLSKNFNLIYKPHPNQKTDDLKCYDFNLFKKDNKSEEILLNDRNEIFAVFGISSTTMRFADLLGIKTYSLRYIFQFDDNEVFENLFLSNTNIIHIKKMNHLEKTIESFK